MKKISKIVSFVLVAVMLLGAVPAYAAGGGVAGFTDVRSTDYYADAVEWAKETGVTVGTGAAAFSPAKSVTRAEAVTFLWRAAGCPEPASQTSPYTDVADPGAYYYKPVLWAAEQGITNGVGGNRFGVFDTLAYDQILTFLCRAAGVDAGGGDWSDTAVKWAKANGLTDGLSFSPKGSCPRADVVYCLWKELADESAGLNTTSDKPEQTGGTQTGGTQDGKTQTNAAGLTGLEGAKAAIINGFLNFENNIDVSAYNIEPSELEALAAEIVGSTKYGNFYYITKFWANQAKGAQTAKSLTMYYEDTEEHMRKVLEQVKAISASVVTPGMSDYEIAKALHDYLVLHCAYDSDWNLDENGKPLTIIQGNTAHRAYGALVKGEAVCEGYARAYQALLMYNGVKCIFVAGGDHAWNIVQIDGEWYHVDTTWDDPVPNREGYVRYNYFLKSDAVMRKDHSGWTEYYFISNGNQWTAEHTCTSTKYDNVPLPDTTAQAKQKEQAAEQERLNEVAAQVLAFLTEAIDSLPYRTAAELQAAETLTSSDAYPKISFPSGRFSASDLSKIRDQLKTAISERYPDYELMSVSSSNCQIKRSDVLQETARRTAARQAETDAHAAEIEALVQKAIREGDVRALNYEVSLPAGYTLSEVKKAIANMNAAGYSFDGYTANVDYKLLSVYSIAKVTVRNLRYEEWAEKETLRYVELIQAAIRNGETQVLLPPGDYPDKTDIYFAAAAAVRVKTDGYSFDGLTSGVDYTITKTFIQATREYVVQLAYPDGEM